MLKDRVGLAFGFATGRMTMAFDGSGSTTSTFEEMLTFFLEPAAFATGLMTNFFFGESAGGSAGGGRGGGVASPGALLEALVRVEVVVRVDSTLRLRPLELGALVLAEPMLLGGRPLAFGAGAGVAIGGSIVVVSGVCGIGIGGVS